MQEGGGEGPVISYAWGGREGKVEFGCVTVIFTGTPL